MKAIHILSLAITGILLVFCISGCELPDEWHIFDEEDVSLEYCRIDVLSITEYGTELAEFENYDDMQILFELTKELTLTKAYEGNDLPPDFDYYFDVGFIHFDKRNPELSPHYGFKLSKTGDIYVIKQRLAAKSIFYAGHSEEILHEVTRLIELYQSQNEPTDQKVEVVEIIDIAKRDNIDCDDALQQFYSDAEYHYFYPSIKSEYVVVKYSNNTEETVENALKNNKITISDLDRFEIKYFKEKK